MTGIRDDARRAVTARRERTLTAPAPAIAPLAVTIGVAAVTAVVLGVVGVGLTITVAGTVAVLLVGACAAHRTTSSYFAGLTLRVVRPYRSGERVMIYVRERGTTVEAEVVRIGRVNTTLATASGLVAVPNVRMLRAAPDRA